MASIFDDIGKFFGGLFSGGSQSDQQEQQRRQNANTFKSVQNNNSLNGGSTSQFSFGNSLGNQDSLAAEQERKRKEEEERKRKEEERRKEEEARKAREAAQAAQEQQLAQQRENAVQAAQGRLKKGQTATPFKPEILAEAQKRNSVNQPQVINKQQLVQQQQNNIFKKDTLPVPGQQGNNQQFATKEERGSALAERAKRNNDEMWNRINTRNQPNVDENTNKLMNITEEINNRFKNKTNGQDLPTLYRDVTTQFDALADRAGLDPIARRELGDQYLKLVRSNLMTRAAENEQNSRMVMGMIPIAGVSNAVLQAGEDLDAGRNKEMYEEINLARQGVDSATFNQMDDETKQKLRNMNELQKMNYLDVLSLAPGVGLATGAIKGTGKAGAKEVAKNITKGAVGGGVLGGAMNVGAQAYMNNGEIDWSAVPESVLLGLGIGAGGGVLDLPSGSQVVKNTKNVATKAGDTVRDVISKDGPMGREYTQFNDGAQSQKAADYVDRRGQGVAREAVLASDDVKYDLPYGRIDTDVQSGYGLSHIRDDHDGGMNNVYNTIRTIEDGTLDTRQPWNTRSRYELGDQRAVAANNYLGNEQYKPILTGYQKTGDAGTNPTDTARPVSAEIEPKSNQSANTNSVAKNATNVNSKLEVVQELGDGTQIVRETTPSGSQREFQYNPATNEAQEITAARQAVKASRDMPSVEEQINEPLSGMSERSGVIKGLKASSSDPSAYVLRQDNTLSQATQLDPQLSRSTVHTTQSQRAIDSQRYRSSSPSDNPSFPNDQRQYNPGNPLPYDSNVSQNGGVVKGVKNYVDQQVKDQQKSSKLPLRQKMTGTYDNLRHFLVDDAVAYERYIKNKGERVVLREGVDRVRNSDMVAKQWAEDHGIAGLGKMAPEDMNEFSQYLIAKRSQELKRQKGPQFKTGRDDAMDQALIESVGSKYAREEQLVRDYNKSMLDYSVDNNLISGELRDKLLADSTDYVPMNRVMDDVDKAGVQTSKQLGSLSKQNVVKKIKGSDRTVENPIESMILNTQRMVNEAERNKVAMRLADSSDLAERVLKEGEKPRPGYDTLSYLADGRKNTVEVPALVAKEMKNLNSVMPDFAKEVLKVVGAPTRMLRTGATSANPVFAVSNVVRDQIQTLFTGNIRTTLNSAANTKAFRASFDPASAEGKALRAELARNGIIGSEYRQTYGYKSGELMKELQDSTKLSRQAIDKLKHPIDSIADLIGRTEYYTRAQQFYGTLNRGGTIEQASQAARNNTLNFGRAGATTRVLNKVIPFLNAGVQGGRILTKQLAERPARTVTMLAATVGIAAAASAINQAQNPELWDRLGDEEKKNNLIIFGEDAHYDPETNRVEGIAKIPMPQMLYPVLDAVNNIKGTDPESMLNVVANLLTAFTGIDVENPVNQLTPTAIKPFVEAGMNTNFYTGNNLVSEYESNMTPEDKGAKYSTGVARGIASAIGVDAPVVDNFIQAWGGGLAKDLSKGLIDNPDNMRDGDGNPLAIFEESFARRFMSGSVTSQYEIQAELAKGYKNAMRENEAFSALSSDEQKKVLDKIDSDTSAIAGIAAKTEQNRSDEIKKDLSDRQRDIVENGFNVDTYLASAQSSDGGKVISDNEWYNIKEKDGKQIISRKDDQQASYTGDVSGLSQEQINLLSMTQSEVERDQEGDSWGAQYLYNEAKAKALEKALEEAKTGYQNGSKSQQDIKEAENKLFKAQEDQIISGINNLAKKDETFRQQMTEAGVNSVYELVNLYDDTSVTEWRKLTSSSPALYNVLAAYDSARTEEQVSGKSGDKTSNKYYANSSSSKSSSKKKTIQDIITPNLDFGQTEINAPFFNETTDKGKGVIKGLKAPQINTQAQVTALPRVKVR